MLTIVRFSMTLFYLCTLCLTCDSVGDPLRKMLKSTDDVSSDNVMETQHTSCKITTEEMVANARATVTTVLTGACKAKTMDERFAKLEEKLIKEFTDIKLTLYSVLKHQHPIHLENNNFYNEALLIKDNYLSPRQDEIDKFNNTVQILSSSNDSTSVFVYYWQIGNFVEMLDNWQTGRSLRSPTFYTGTGSYAVYLRITPRYFPDGTVFISVGLTRGRYDSVLVWPFPLRIHLEVLDHSPEGMREDRHSRIWDPATVCTESFWGRPSLTGTADNPECVGLSIPRHIILSKSLSTTTFQYLPLKNSRYIWNRNIVIKLVVYS